MSKNTRSMIEADPSRFSEPKHQTKENIDYRKRMGDLFERGVGNTIERLENFPKYVPRQRLTHFLAKYEIWRLIQDVHGSIVECGVLFGGGLMSWAQFSAIFEPVNYQRKIFGFDTFAGFPRISDEDRSGERSAFAEEGGFAVDSFRELQECVELYDANRFLNHIPKVELIKGDAAETIPHFLEDHPHAVVSLLYLDFDIFEPTRVALEHFIPRMPKGGVIAFDELNCDTFPGETQAVLKIVGLDKLRIRRFPFEPYISYAVLE